jgi:hypothetical protein
LEAFRAKVANLITAEDMVKDDHEDGYEPTQEDVDEMRDRFDDESLMSDNLALDALIDEARALAAKEGGAA